MLVLRDVTHLCCQTRLSEAWGSPKDEVPAEGLWGDSGRASGVGISSPRAILPRCHERAAGPHGPRWPQLPRSHAGGRAPRCPTGCSGAQRRSPTAAFQQLLASRSLRASGVCTRVLRLSWTGCSHAFTQASHRRCHATGWLHSPKDG